MKTDNGKDSQSNTPKSFGVEGEHGSAKDPESVPSVHADEIEKNEAFVRMADESNLEAGERLLRLRVAKAYKTRGYKSHGEHVESLGLTRSRASQLERAARLLRKLKEIAEEGEALPKAEGKLRPLLKFVASSKGEVDDGEAELALKVWREAVKEGGTTVRVLEAKVAEELREGSGGVSLESLPEISVEQDAKTHEASIPEPSLSPGAAYREAATYANGTLKLFNEYKDDPWEEGAVEIERRLREVKDYFDALDEASVKEAA